MINIINLIINYVHNANGKVVKALLEFNCFQQQRVREYEKFVS